jgi:hypothetical protein
MLILQGGSSIIKSIRTPSTTQKRLGFAVFFRQLSVHILTGGTNEPDQPDVRFIYSKRGVENVAPNACRFLRTRQPDERTEK